MRINTNNIQLKHCISLVYLAVVMWNFTGDIVIHRLDVDDSATPNQGTKLIAKIYRPASKFTGPPNINELVDENL